MFSLTLQKEFRFIIRAICDSKITSKCAETSEKKANQVEKEKEQVESVAKKVLCR